MSRPVVPLTNLARRVPQAGRLRTGIQVPKRSGDGTRPSTIETWRATSHDENAIREIAKIYGGTPRPWTDAPTAGQWEVVTESSTLDIVLPPNPLGEPPWETPIYELWSGGGCQRRCDGLAAQVPVQGPDGAEMNEVPCICNARGAMTCTPHTRLTVILPDVPFGGVWRYESAKSWNVAQEMPGMVDLIRSLQDEGLSRAVLALETRRSGQTGKPFTIPVLRVPASFNEIVAGANQVAVLGAAPETPVAIGPGSGAGNVPDLDDEITDAEIVEDDDPPAVTLPAETTPEQIAAWDDLARRLPLILGDHDATAFKQWMRDGDRRWKPSSLAAFEEMVGEARARYARRDGGPRTWPDRELTDIRRAITELHATGDWDAFNAVAFENLADGATPETWTESQYTALSTWLRIGAAPASNEGTPHAEDRIPA